MSKILIIEDETALREVIAEFLFLSGYEVFEARDGLEGLEKVKNEKPDLILCDIMMPKLDGHGFLREHQFSIYSYIPVLFLAAKIEEQDKSIGFALGAKEFISKPFNFKELIVILNSYLFSNNNSVL